ncbi:quinone oxidoreductase family protein [Paenibacillus sp. GCM10023252]|uniref:quinone oxidoreductase family protein n=1 Tax=Paenibacillus sp. GCM10023252 TaxID=3252649 RepID=UPI0036074F8B
MRALCFHTFGGPEVLHMKELPDPELKAGHLVVRMKAIGLNYADIYRRKGNYHLTGTPPYILGYEGAGVVEEVGEGVSGFRPGDRIAFADVPHSNAELVAVPQHHAIPLPDSISFETAASLLLQGLTAQYLAKDSYLVREGDEVLVHAAAGGVGGLLVQLCKLQGAAVIGLTSTVEKGEAARQAGADHVLLYTDDWAARVKSLSADGQGIDVAYDSVGSTIMDSFAAVRTKGTVVFYGMAGGDPVSIDPRMLMDTSKTLTGGDLWNHITSQAERTSRAAELFGLVQAGKLKVSDPAVFSLSDGADAHRLLESRKSTGKIILIP